VYPNNLGVEDIAKAMNFDIVALDKPIKVNETVVIVNKNEQKLADEIEAALEKLSKDGTLQKISEKWYHRNLFDQLKEAQAEAGK
jgi:ABC-type amino acid transport substrate-binding protein